MSDWTGYELDFLEEFGPSKTSRRYWPNILRWIVGLCVHGYVLFYLVPEYTVLAIIFILLGFAGLSLMHARDGMKDAEQENGEEFMAAETKFWIEYMTIGLIGIALTFANNLVGISFFVFGTSVIYMFDFLNGLKRSRELQDSELSDAMQISANQVNENYQQR